MKILILAERCNTFLSLRPLRPPWEHLGSPRCFSEASQALHRCFKNYNFGYESGPHGSPRHDTLSQRSATPPPTFLSPSQAPKNQFSTKKSKKSRKPEKLQFFSYFPVWGPTLGSFRFPPFDLCQGFRCLVCGRARSAGSPPRLVS